MTEEQFKNLTPGDEVRGRSSQQTYIVTAHYGDHVIAVRSIELTNPTEWDLLTVVTRHAR